MKKINIYILFFIVLFLPINVMPSETFIEYNQIIINWFKAIKNIYYTNLNIDTNSFGNIEKIMNKCNDDENNVYNYHKISKQKFYGVNFIIGGSYNYPIVDINPLNYSTINYIGISVDVLKNGIFSYDKKLDYDKINLQLIQYKIKTIKKIERNICFIEEVYSNISREYLKFNQIYLNFLDTITTIYNFFYENRLISKSKYLNIQKRYKNIKTLSLLYSQIFNNKDEETLYLPLFYLNKDKILNTIIADTMVYFYTKRMLEFKNNSKFYNRTTLTLYSKLKVYDNIINNTNLEIGFNFKYPLYDYYNMNEIYKTIIEDEKILNIIRTKQKIIILLKEFEINKQKIIDYIYDQYLILDQLEGYVELIKNGKIEFSSIDKIIKLISNFFDDQQNIIKLKQSQYLILGKILEITKSNEINSFVGPYNLKLYNKGNFKYLNKIKKNNSNDIILSLYLWSSGINNLSTNEIEKTINKYKNIKKVLISYSSKINKVKLDSLLSFFMKRDINVYILISNNNYINIDKKEIKNKIQKRILDILKLKRKYSNIKGIHLDIEPHMIDKKWRNNKKLMDNYIKMLKFFYENKKDLKLEAAIGYFYPKKLEYNIYKYSDMVYIMIYNIFDINKFADKLKEELDISRSKTTIVLRATDFPNKKILFNLINKLKSSLNIDNFAIHNFREFVKLKDYEVKK